MYYLVKYTVGTRIYNCTSPLFTFTVFILRTLHSRHFSYLSEHLETGWIFMMSTLLESHPAALPLICELIVQSGGVWKFTIACSTQSEPRKGVVRGPGSWRLKVRNCPVSEQGVLSAFSTPRPVESLAWACRLCTQELVKAIPFPPDSFKYRLEHLVQSLDELADVECWVSFWSASLFNIPYKEVIPLNG